VLVDAIVLTGGRSSRLDFTPKSEFVVEDRTLLQRTLEAVNGARSIVIVGPAPAAGLPETVLRVQEQPPFGGPVAGIFAGLAALAESSTIPSDATLVLACDMPHIGRAIPRLLRGLVDNPESDGVIAVDSGQRLQPLAAGYRTARLASALAARTGSGSLAAMPVFRLIDGLHLTPIDVPVDATADVDSWDDANRLGARAPVSSPPIGEAHE
jgi:molybdopterin-guanine dinucleotide biosynthesis protein A